MAREALQRARGNFQEAIGIASDVMVTRPAMVGSISNVTKHGYLVVSTGSNYTCSVRVCAASFTGPLKETLKGTLNPVTVGARIITYTILWVPYYNYNQNMIYPKILF